MNWRPIETVPNEGQVLVTTDDYWDYIEGGFPSYSQIELVNLPFLKDGRVMNQNSGNYTQAEVWKWWMPVPEAPPR